MYFEILGDIKDVEVIATGPSIRRLPELQARYGPGRHWYEAHGIGRRNFKVKRRLD